MLAWATSTCLLVGLRRYICPQWMVGDDQQVTGTAYRSNLGAELRQVFIHFGVATMFEV